MSTAPMPSVNGQAALLVDALVEQQASLRIATSRGGRGERRIDLGSSVAGGVAAGLKLAEICMGGLGAVSLMPQDGLPRWPWHLVVRSSLPVLACLASQYAGWSLKHEDGKNGFFALGSGPARALAVKEPVFEHIGYRDVCDRAVIVLEAGDPPPPEIVSKLAQDCGVDAGKIEVLFAPTHSLAGSVQVVARVLEVALHKAHELGFPLARIADGMGAAPLCPPHPDFVTAMGRTNDAIIYGGSVHLFVTGDAADAKELAEALPSRQSRDYGKPFAEIFKAVKGDFYAIDPMLFSPARVIVSALDHGLSFHAGELDPGLLDASFA